MSIRTHTSVCRGQGWVVEMQEGLRLLVSLGTHWFVHRIPSDIVLLPSQYVVLVCSYWGISELLGELRGGGHQLLHCVPAAPHAQGFPLTHPALTQLPNVSAPT